MTDQDYAVIMVSSINHAVQVEKLLAEQDILTKMIPVPRHLSSRCGVCVRISQSDLAAVEQLLAAAPVKIEGIHPI